MGYEDKLMIEKHFSERRENIVKSIKALNKELASVEISLANIRRELSTNDVVNEGHWFTLHKIG
jgi:hypothetical protein